MTRIQKDGKIKDTNKYQGGDLKQYTPNDILLLVCWYYSLLLTGGRMWCTASSTISTRSRTRSTATATSTSSRGIVVLILGCCLLLLLLWCCICFHHFSNLFSILVICLSPLSSSVVCLFGSRDDRGSRRRKNIHCTEQKGERWYTMNLPSKASSTSRTNY